MITRSITHLLTIEEDNPLTLLALQRRSKENLAFLEPHFKMDSVNRHLPSSSTKRKFGAISNALREAGISHTSSNIGIAMKILEGKTKGIRGKAATIKEALIDSGLLIAKDTIVEAKNLGYSGQE